MALEKITTPYEVLVRLCRRGIEAAHVVYLEEIMEDGVVIAARELPPTDLALAGPEFGTIMEAINQNALVQVNDLTTERDALLARVAELTALIPAPESPPAIGE